jgi:two-component system response regulator NreC
VILDDHPVVRAGLRLLLQQDDGLEIVAEASTLAEALALDIEADVILADLVLKDARGAEVVAALRRARPSVAVFVLTMMDEPEEIIPVLEAGAQGFMLKEAAPADLIDAVRRVGGGETYLQPSLGASLVRKRESPSRNRQAAESTAALTPRERDVLHLLALGHTNAEMSSLLSMSVRTVEVHRARLMRKVGAQTRAELVRFAADAGLLEFRLS